MSILLFNFDVAEKFRELCFSIDEVIYNFVSYLFNVFDVLARTRLFSSDLVSDLTNRTYIILSVVMLFALAYSFMTIIINPDKASSGDKTGFGIVKRIIIALVVLVFTPTVFEFAYGVQESVIDNNVIGKLLVGSSTDFQVDNVKGDFVVSLFQGSFYVKQNASDLAKLEYQDATISAKVNGDISAYEDLLEYVPGEVKYNNLISLVVGIFAAYCLVIFCFDLGVRCAKLAFYEMIVPIPALMYIIPGKESAFKTWSKEVLSTFFEVFVRVAIIFFMTYVFNIIGTAFDNGTLLGELASTGSTVGVAVKLFIIIGLLVFALRAPKLICDILGIKPEGILSFKKRWDEGKKAVMAASTPVRKVAGSATGFAAAKAAYRRGVKNGNTDTRFKRLSAGFHGLVNGWRSGVMNAGNAYDYELERQQSYARNPELGGVRGVLRAEREQLQRKFGFESPYEYERRDELMKMENDVRRARRENQNYQEQKQVFDKNAHAIFDSYINDNKDAYDKNESLDSSVKSWVGKASSKLRRTLDLDEISAATAADIAKKDADIRSLQSKGDLTDADQKKLTKLQGDKADLERRLRSISESKERINGILDPNYLSKQQQISKLEEELRAIPGDQQFDINTLSKKQELQKLKDSLGKAQFTGNYSELERLSEQISSNEDLSFNERQLLESLIGGLKKDIINEHKATVITDASKGIVNDDASSSSIAQELISMLNSNDTSIGRQVSQLSDAEIKQMAEAQTGKQMTQEQIDKLREKFQMDKESAIAKFREILKNGGTFSCSDVKDIGDELNALTNGAAMAKRHANTNVEFKVLDYDNLVKQFKAESARLKAQGATKQALDDLERAYREKMYTSGYDTDVIMKRNKDLIEQRQEEFKDFEFTHLNDKEIAESQKRIADLGRKIKDKGKGKQ